MKFLFGSTFPRPLRSLAHSSSSCPRPSVRQWGRQAFTMVEVMVTLSLLSVFSAMTVSTLRNVVSSTALSTGTREFSNLLTAARSEAISRRTVVRFAVVKQGQDGSEGSLHKASLWELSEDRKSFVQFTAWTTLPKGILVEPELPAYVRTTTYASDDATSIRGDYVMGAALASNPAFTTDSGKTTMQCVEFLPTGSVRVPGGTSRNVIFVLVPGTLNSDGSVEYSEKSLEGPIKWEQVNLDSLTGRTRIYKP